MEDLKDVSPVETGINPPKIKLSLQQGSDTHNKAKKVNALRENALQGKYNKHERRKHRTLSY